MIKIQIARALLGIAKRLAGVEYTEDNPGPMEYFVSDILHIQNNEIRISFRVKAREYKGDMKQWKTRNHLYLLHSAIDHWFHEKFEELRRRDEQRDSTG